MLPFITAILTILLLQQSAAFRFEEVNPDVNVTSFDPLLIFMDENNLIPTTLIRVVNASSQLTLQYIGQSLHLGVVSDSEGNWLIRVEEVVDYDANPSAMAQGFTINVIDSASNQVISLKINNLHDNNPILVPSSCNLTENTTITFENACEFQIQDADGWLESLDFSNIKNSANGNESDIFVFRYRDIPPDNAYAWPVFLMLQDGLVLDYENTTMYVFHVTVTDAVGNPSPNTQIIIQVEEIPDNNNNNTFIEY